MLATFREKHLLRRVYITPMPPWIFFASLVVYRVTLLAAQAIILVAVGALVFQVRIIGQPLEILAILLLGTATFVSIDRFPHAVTSAPRLLPSTQFIDTFRDVSVYGEPLTRYGIWIAALVVWTPVGTAISARTFRWV